MIVIANLSGVFTPLAHAAVSPMQSYCDAMDSGNKWKDSALKQIWRDYDAKEKKKEEIKRTIEKASEQEKPTAKIKGNADEKAAEKEYEQQWGKFKAQTASGDSVIKDATDGLGKLGNKPADCDADDDHEDGHDDHGKAGPQGGGKKESGPLPPPAPASQAPPKKDDPQEEKPASTPAPTSEPTAQASPSPTPTPDTGVVIAPQFTPQPKSSRAREAVLLAQEAAAEAKKQLDLALKMDDRTAKKANAVHQGAKGAGAVAAQPKDASPMLTALDGTDRTPKGKPSATGTSSKRFQPISGSVGAGALGIMADRIPATATKTAFATKDNSLLQELRYQSQRALK